MAQVVLLAAGSSACGVETFTHGPSEDVAIGSDLNSPDACPVDRSTACFDEDAEGCDGYPSGGPFGWGDTVGRRLRNIELFDGNGDPHELAELLAEHDDGQVCGRYSGALMIDLGARWCTGCARESTVIADSYERWRERGANVVNVLVGGNDGWEGAPQELCQLWPNIGAVGADDEVVEVPFPVWCADERTAAKLRRLHEPGDAGEGSLPLRVFLDANANIRDVLAGEVSDPVKVIERRFDEILEAPFGSYDE
ncbi:MAG: hypothetical protein B7733_13385 [Myxococcales bacterium FL481]|nr:MAG: hypothetical protein B7733_13385 [Myxococcales bacterium FL481]